ncbi:hypothetical protein JCM8097_001653 [Rhodosporidiobolus ruineniae]
MPQRPGKPVWAATDRSLSLPEWVQQYRCLCEHYLSVVPPFVLVVLLLPVRLIAFFFLLGFSVFSVLALSYSSGFFDALWAVADAICAAWLERGWEVAASARSSSALLEDLQESVDALVENAVELTQQHFADAAERRAFQAVVRPFSYTKLLRLNHEFVALTAAYMFYSEKVPTAFVSTALYIAYWRNFHLGCLAQLAFDLLKTDFLHFLEALAISTVFLAALAVFSPSTLPFRTATCLSSLRAMAPKHPFGLPFTWRTVVSAAERFEPLHIWLDELDSLVCFKPDLPLDTLHPWLLDYYSLQRQVAEEEAALGDTVLDVVLARSMVRRILRERVEAARSGSDRSE